MKKARDLMSHDLTTASKETPLAGSPKSRDFYEREGDFYKGLGEVGYKIS